MKWIIACEFSGAVRRAMRKRGIEAFSCDYLRAEDGVDEEWHIQGDILSHLERNKGIYGGMIAFPPCTHIASSGAVYWPQKQKDGRQLRAIQFIESLMSCGIEKIALENPVGILSTIWRKPDQIINPFQFGDPYRKKTCLWLKNLPPLVPTNIVEPIGSWHSGGRYGGRRKDGSRKVTPPTGNEKRSGHDRSRTFQGIADAMAEQWGCL